VRKYHGCVLLLLVVAIIIVHTMPALAANSTVVAVDQSRILIFNSIQRVAVANPEIADVGVISGSELLLIGKAPGVTTVHVWTSDGRISLSVEVGTDDSNIANAIKNTLGYTDIRVSKINKAIILEGTVNDQYQKTRAEKVAGAYGEKVINLLEITSPTQVKLEAKIIEIDREKVRNIGITWGNLALAPGTFAFGQSSINSIISQTNVLGSLGTYSDINAQLNALVKNGSAKILSQPSIITLSGSKANIMVGGEIPIPVGLDNGRVTIDWKEYGIKLEIEPEVNAEGLIQSKVNAEVSTLDWNSTHRIKLGSGMEIPPIKSRKANSTIALTSGQTMAIAGLIASETARDVYKVPLLGDIPIIGKLFRSTSFTKGETELIILITPSIVNPETYTPNSSQELKDFSAENPWGSVNEVKDKK